MKFTRFCGHSVCKWPCHAHGYWPPATGLPRNQRSPPLHAMPLTKRRQPICHHSVLSLDSCLAIANVCNRPRLREHAHRRSEIVPIAVCPECDAELHVDEEIDKGEQLTCTECDSLLEVVGLDPIELDAVASTVDEDSDQDEDY